MKEEIIKAIEEKRLTEFVIDQYNNMPMKTVKKLLIVLSMYLREEDKEELIYDIKTLYHEDFEY